MDRSPPRTMTHAAPRSTTRAARAAAAARLAAHAARPDASAYSVLPPAPAPFAGVTPRLVISAAAAARAMDWACA